MGGTKRLIEIYDDLGYALSGNYYVCLECLVCSHLIKEMKRVTFRGICSFCESKRKVLDVEDFFKEIVEAIREDGWVRAVDEGSYDSGEGGFQQECIERREIAKDISIEAGVTNDKLLVVIENSFDDEWMIDKPYGQDYLDDIFRNGWDVFQNRILHDRRYTYFIEKDCQAINQFSLLMNYLMSYNIVNIDQDQILYRGRTFDENTPVEKDPNKYGPPPIEKTKNCRMSPKGISYFYCSTDENTVISEIKRKNTKSIGLIQYNPKKNLKILDLSSIIRKPCPFDKTHRIYRKGIDFLNEFILEISKPVVLDDKEHIDYIPTQVIAEYIKGQFFSKGIIGVKYNSEKSKNGFNYVFFCSEDVGEYFELISESASFHNYN